jgi:hypothetical protein
VTASSGVGNEQSFGLTSDRSDHLPNAHARGCGSDGRERPIPIVEEISRSVIFGKALPELLRGPGGRGMRGDGDVCTTRRRSCARMTNTTRSRYVMVGTTKKSAAIIWVT